MKQAENQVTNLELSKKLKELGYPQEGLFWWHPLSPGVNVPHTHIVLYGENITDEQNPYTECVAPTAAELLARMPTRITWRGATHHLNIDAHTSGYISWKDRYSISYIPNDSYVSGNAGVEFCRREKGITDISAKMLIWLIENKYVNFESKDSQ